MKVFPLLPIQIGLIVMVLAGCDAFQRYKVLSCFFDGVPQPHSNEKKQPVNEQKPTQSAKSQPARIFSPPADLTIVSHYPYAQHQCDACHLSGTSQKLKAEGSDLCFQCHNNFLDGAEVKHFPAENGMCLDCHEPHQSKNMKLLRERGVKLCSDCHDIFSQTATAKHPPASVGMCLACHDPHVSKNPSLLVRTGQALCTNCHILDKLVQTSPHDIIGDQACIDCHLPHEGEEKLIRP